MCMDWCKACILAVLSLHVCCKCIYFQEFKVCQESGAGMCLAGLCQGSMSNLLGPIIQIMADLLYWTVHELSEVDRGQWLSWAGNLLLLQQFTRKNMCQTDTRLKCREVGPEINRDFACRGEVVMSLVLCRKHTLPSITFVLYTQQKHSYKYKYMH